MIEMQSEISKQMMFCSRLNSSVQLLLIRVTSKRLEEDCIGQNCPQKYSRHY